MVGQHLPDRRQASALLDLQEPFFLLVQPSELRITNSIDFTVAAPGPAGLPVVFDNPATSAWTAKARAFAKDGSFSTPAKEPWWEVKLPAGKRTHTVVLPLPKDALGRMLQLQLWEKVQVQHSTRPIPQPLTGFETDALSHFTFGDEATSGETKLESAPASDACPAGGPTAKLSYRFGKGHKYPHLTPASETLAAQFPRDAHTFGLWVHGDGKGCLTRIRFVDAKGQTFQADGPRLDFTGWRFLTFPLRDTPDAPLMHWGGPDDGSIHHPVKWDTLLLIDNTAHEPIEGSILIAAPAVLD